MTSNYYYDRVIYKITDKSFSEKFPKFELFKIGHTLDFESRIWNFGSILNGMDDLKCEVLHKLWDIPKTDCQIIESIVDEYYCSDFLISSPFKMVGAASVRMWDTQIKPHCDDETYEKLINELLLFSSTREGSWGPTEWRLCTLNKKPKLHKSCLIDTLERECIGRRGTLNFKSYYKNHFQEGFRRGV